MELGIDIGGTKIAGGLVHNGKVVKRVCVPTGKTRAEILAQLKGVIAELSGKRKLKIGIGVPGSFNGTTAKHLPHVTALDGVDLRKSLGVPLVLENDARCFALAEHTCGAAKGKRNSVGLILGTGVGSGVIINNQLYRGAHGTAGEVGPIQFPTITGVTDYEELLRGPGIVARHAARGGMEDNPAAIWRSSSDAAKRTRAETEQLLTLLLADITTTLDPDVIVLGGGLSNLPLLGPARKGLPQHCRYGHYPLLRQSKLGADAGIIGAALVAKGN